MSDFITSTETINYQYLRSMHAINGQKLETVEDYVQWVRNWKLIHSQLVQAITTMRALKNRAKHHGDTTLTATQYWVSKKQLGGYARQMYAARIKNKADLKAGVLKELETA